ncbi:choice-of-anchor J domain-containing protein [Flavobacterium difficile]|uniref:DUF5017 domain-containing protein n=1 Tax=Flavobacterium difficile TaxID=2709659 RepID=A0ABX0I6G2_9FLAO|nr:choice-of-anchor J domain-containing protein [Flavobacterium difficile]NHM02291.1 DUF5017 domain-containing protein [Flavobacterium difficile]
MKNIFLKSIVAFTTLVTFTSCEDPETEVAPFKPVVFKENFNPDLLGEDEYLNYNGWKSFAEIGTVEWTEQDDEGNGYIQFTTFSSGTGNPVNVAWAITPAINLDNSQNEVLTFKSAAEFVTDAGNKLEVYISTNFDGNNVLAATWTPITANIAGLATNLPSGSPDGTLNVDSGEVDLSSYTGTIHIAFKATGSSTNSNLDGSLRVDDVKIYDKTL